MRGELIIAVVLVPILGVGVVRAGIAIHHKALRRNGVITEVPYEEIFASSSSGRKIHLVTKEQEGCDDLESPPSVTLESLSLSNGGQEKLDWVILLKDVDNCSWSSRIMRAKVKGYSGVIVYAVKTEGDMELRETDWNSLEGFHFNISIVNLEDVEKLQNFTYPKPYIITVNKDRRWIDELLEDPLVLRTIKIAFCISLVVWGLIWFRKKWQEVQDEDNWERTWYKNIFNNDDNSEEDADEDQDQDNLLERYRRLLGVQPEATKKEIESAYRIASLKYHDDKIKHLNLSEDEINRRKNIFKTDFPNAKKALLKACVR